MDSGWSRRADRFSRTYGSPKRSGREDHSLRLVLDRRSKGRSNPQPVTMHGIRALGADEIARDCYHPATLVRYVQVCLVNVRHRHVDVLEKRHPFSRWKRAIRSGSEASAAGSTFTATSRFSLVSVARYTSPIPPTPIWAVISYGPRRVPGVRPKLAWIIRTGRSFTAAERIATPLT